MAKKVYIGAETPIPEITVEPYLQSSGTQYINTNFIPNNNTRVVIDIEFLASSAAFVFGARANNSLGILSFSLTTQGYGFRSDYGATESTISITFVNKRLTIDKNKNVTSVGTLTSTNSAETFSSVYPLSLLAVNTAGSIGQYTSAKLYSCKVYDNGTLVRDFIPKLDNNGVACLYDKVEGKYYYNAGTGSFGYGEIVTEKIVEGGATEPRAREVKKIYVGVGNVARLVKKGYIGIGGVARPFLGDKKPQYYGAITGLSLARSGMGAANTGDYLLFAGADGGMSTLIKATVDAYDSTLTRTIAPEMSAAKGSPAGVRTESYAIFAGGTNSKLQASNIVDAYNSSLTRSTPTTLSATVQYAGSARIGAYALVAGGYNRNAGSYVNTVNAYNNSLTRSTPTALSVTSGDGTCGGTIGNYAVFFCGYPNQSVVNAYSSNLTRTVPTGLSLGRYWGTATNVGDYLLFAGGYNRSNGSYVGTVDVYDKNLTRTSAADLSKGRYQFASASLNNEYAIFAGGGLTQTNAVDIYDKTLTRTDGTALSIARSGLAGGSTGNYVLFAGGYGGSSYRDRVDAYVLA